MAQQPADLADDETWLGAVELRSQDVVSAKGDLVDVVATGSGVRFSQAGLTAQQLDIDATIPFATVAEQVGQDVTIYDAGNGKTGVERQVTILGRDLTLKATGTVSADGGQLLIEPETVDLGGPSFLDSAASTLARSLATIRQDVAGVPRGDVADRRPGDPRGLRRPAQRHRRGHRPLSGRRCAGVCVSDSASEASRGEHAVGVPLHWNFPKTRRGLRPSNPGLGGGLHTATQCDRPTRLTRAAAGGCAE